MIYASHFLILALLFLFSAFFSGTETALFSLSPLDKRRIRENASSSKTAKLILSHINHPKRTLGTILVGNLLVNTWAASFVTLITIELLGYKWVGTTVTLFTLLLIILCEMLPKIFAVTFKIQFASFSSYPLAFFMVVFSPLRMMLQFVSDKIIHGMLGTKTSSVESMSEKELKVLVKIGEEEGVLDADERDMIHDLLELGERSVYEIMTPRTDLVALDADEAPEKHLEFIKKHHFTNLPVYQGSKDQIIGVIESQKYLLNPDTPVRTLMNKPIFIPESKHIDDLLALFRKQNRSFAVCVDEHGGTEGIVTLEDILEEIFGEFYDEYSKEETPIKKMRENVYLIQAKVTLDDFNEFFKTELECDEASTLGGYLLDNMGEVPSKGMSYETDQFEFHIQDMIRQRIRHVIVRRKK